MRKPFLFSSVFAFLILLSCDNNKTFDDTEPTLTIKGTGNFVFTQYTPLADKPVPVYYHIPENTTEDSPVLIVFHGAGRDAMENRDALIEKANQLSFIVVVPKFTDEAYPGGDAYNLGNVFVDGDNPSPSTLNDESVWTFSIIDPIFNYIKTLTGNTQPYYDAFGFSAGGQFAHRLVMFKPNANFNRVVASSSGWYTMPQNDVVFPYGLEESPADNMDFGGLFALPLTVMIGGNDDDPNSPGLRHNEYADAQGFNRLTRAQYFYNQSSAMAQSAGLPWNWSYVQLPNVEHDFFATSEAAVDMLYN